jgi:catechol 2,3-dioxygenase-like lactoylglutathione lyase family enzyme
VLQYRGLQARKGGTVIDHIGLNVADYARSRAFYTQAFEPLGYSIVMDFEPHGIGFGPEDKPIFWVVRRDPPGAAHVAFTAPDRETVDAFYEAALAAGGTDNGPPGIREHYHPTYYAAFVLDPDGNNIEAVTHR